MSMPTELVSELRSRTDRLVLSSYITEAARHQLAVDGLAEIVAAHEENHGAHGAGDRSRPSRAVRRRERRGCRAGRCVKEQPARSLVLAAETLSLLLRNDRGMAARIEASRQVGVPVLVSALTIVEAMQGKTDRARLKWVPSRLRVEPVSQEDSLTAVAMLHDAGGLHGRKYAIDALVAALALRRPGHRDRSDIRPGRLVQALRAAGDHQGCVSTVAY